MQADKDSEELKKLFLELKKHDERDLPSFDELMNRPGKKVRAMTSFSKVAAAAIAVITCGTIIYFTMSGSHQKVTSGPFADKIGRYIVRLGTQTLTSHFHVLCLNLPSLINIYKHGFMPRFFSLKNSPFPLLMFTIS